MRNSHKAIAPVKVRFLLWLVIWLVGSAFFVVLGLGEMSGDKNPSSISRVVLSQLWLSLTIVVGIALFSSGRFTLRRTLTQLLTGLVGSFVFLRLPSWTFHSYLIGAAVDLGRSFFEAAFFVAALRLSEAYRKGNLRFQWTYEEPL